MDYVINFLFLGFVYYWFFYRRWIKKPKSRLLLKTVMYVYIVMVLFVTLMPFKIPLGVSNNLFMDTANFTPFRDLILNYRGAEREILLNIVMMMPFGFLYPIITKRGIVRTVTFTFLFSLIIECYQLLGVWWGINSRSFDITDIITNTFGGLIGFVIFVLFKRVIKSRYKESSLLLGVFNLKE